MRFLYLAIGITSLISSLLFSYMWISRGLGGGRRRRRFWERLWAPFNTCVWNLFWWFLLFFTDRHSKALWSFERRCFFV